MTNNHKFAGVSALLILVTLNHTAQATNTAVETALMSSGDVSLFYQAMTNTGVLASLREDQTYTIFAPTNMTLAQVRQSEYPCFYNAACRPQIAALLRNHIVLGGRNLKQLTAFGSGIKSWGGRVAHVEEPYVRDYKVDGYNILSKNEIDGNVIYRINGILASQQDLSVYRTMAFHPPSGAMTTQTTTYSTTTPNDDDEDSVTTTTIRSTIIQP